MDLDFLEIRNGKICNASGEQVQLRGTCVGGWMNMENFINGYPGSELGVRLAVPMFWVPARRNIFLTACWIKCWEKRMLNS